MLNSDNAEAMREQLRERLNARDWGGALDILSALEKLDPNDPQILHNTAVTLIQMGRQEDARSYLERALAIRPDYQAAASALAGLGPKQSVIADKPDGPLSAEHEVVASDEIPAPPAEPASGGEETPGVLVKQGPVRMAYGYVGEPLEPGVLSLSASELAMTDDSGGIVKRVLLKDIALVSPVPGASDFVVTVRGETQVLRFFPAS